MVAVRRTPYIRQMEPIPLPDPLLAVGCPDAGGCRSAPHGRGSDGGQRLTPLQLAPRGVAMTMQQVGGELRFDAPGPGSWTLDSVHFPRPLTRYWQETHREPFMRGFTEMTRFYGTLLGT